MFLKIFLRFQLLRNLFAKRFRFENFLKCLFLGQSVIHLGFLFSDVKFEQRSISNVVFRGVV